jgi:transcriptional regulator with XRE-family HTH domain
MTEPILDHNRILMARGELNLSQREVAFEVGINPITMSRLEQGLCDEVLSLRTVARLAAALGLSITSLFRQPEPDPAPKDPEADERRLEALLCDARTAASADDIAIALGWSLPRTYAALTALKEGLAGRGTTVFASARRYRLAARSDILTSQERQRLERAHHTRHGLRMHEALLLRQVRNETLQIGWTRMSGKERVAAGSLFKAGLVEIVGDRIALTEDARFSLDIKPSHRRTAP